MSTGPTIITVEIESCRDCDRFERETIGEATYAWCGYAPMSKLMTAWWTLLTPPPDWCPARTEPRP